MSRSQTKIETETETEITNPLNDSLTQSPADSIPFPLFPSHYLTLLLGYPGSAKSLLALHLAARVSVNSPLPPHPFAPNPFSFDKDPFDLDHCDRPPLTVICAKEDDEFTLKLRLAAAIPGGANLRHIKFLPDTCLRPPNKEERNAERFDPERSSDSFLVRSLNYFAREAPIRLVILDPLPAFLETHDAANHPALVRRCLQPLLDFASSHGTIILGISHLAKNPRSPSAPLRALGSAAYPALARSVLLIGPDPAQETGNSKPETRFLITPLKNNFAPLTSTFPFSLRTTPLTLDPARPPIPIPCLDFSTAGVSPASESVPSSDSLLPLSLAPNVERPTPNDIRPDSLDLALQLLSTSLAQGPTRSSQILTEARSLGISPRTLSRARLTLKVTASRHPTSHHWYLSLPTPPPLPPEDFSI